MDAMLANATAASNVSDVTEMSDFDDEDPNCTTFGEFETKLHEFFVFWIEGVLLCALSAVGCAANLATIVIMNKKDMRTFFSHLLIVLSSMDLAFLVFSVIEAFRRSFVLVTDAHVYLFPHFLYPLQSMSMACSIYMTVAIAVERYRAVVFPINLRLSLICTKRMYKRRLAKYLAPVFLLSFLLTLPRFFELEITMQQVNVTSAGSSPDDPAEIVFKPTITPTELRTDVAYNVYYVNLTRLLLTGALPIGMLGYLYCKIYRVLRQHNRNPTLTQQSGLTASTSAASNGTASASRGLLRRQHSGGSTSSLIDESRRHQEDALALLFINIILVFIVCHLPRVLLNLYEMFVIDRATHCFALGLSAYGMWAHIFVCISHLLLVVNASVNILFYIWLNDAFRAHLMVMTRACLTFACVKMGIISPPPECEYSPTSAEPNVGGGITTQASRRGRGFNVHNTNGDNSLAVTVTKFSPSQTTTTETTV